MLNTKKPIYGMESTSCTKIKNCQGKFFGTKRASKPLIQKKRNYIYEARINQSIFEDCGGFVKKI